VAKQIEKYFADHEAGPAPSVEKPAAWCQRHFLLQLSNNTSDAHLSPRSYLTSQTIWNWSKANKTIRIIHPHPSYPNTTLTAEFDLTEMIHVLHKQHKLPSEFHDVNRINSLTLCSLLFSLILSKRSERNRSWDCLHKTQIAVAGVHYKTCQRVVSWRQLRNLSSGWNLLQLLITLGMASTKRKSLSRASITKRVHASSLVGNNGISPLVGIACNRQSPSIYGNTCRNLPNTLNGPKNPLSWSWLNGILARSKNMCHKISPCAKKNFEFLLS